MIRRDTVMWTELFSVDRKAYGCSPFLICLCTGILWQDWINIARFQHFGSSYKDQGWYIGLCSESFIFGVSSSGCTTAINGKYLPINFVSWHVLSSFCYPRFGGLKTLTSPSQDNNFFLQYNQFRPFYRYIYFRSRKLYTYTEPGAIGTTTKDFIIWTELNNGEKHQILQLPFV